MLLFRSCYVAVVMCSHNAALDHDMALWLLVLLGLCQYQ